MAAIHAGPWLSVHPRPLCRVSGQADFTGKRGFFNSHSGGPRARRWPRGQLGGQVQRERQAKRRWGPRPLSWDPALSFAPMPHRGDLGVVTVQPDPNHITQPPTCSPSGASRQGSPCPPTGRHRQKKRRRLLTWPPVVLVPAGRRGDPGKHPRPRTRPCWMSSPCVHPRGHRARGGGPRGPRMSPNA